MLLLNVCDSEHEDLTRQIKDSRDKQLQNELTKALNNVVARMEVKGEQIVKLKRCQELVTCLHCFPVILAVLTVPASALLSEN